MKSDVLKIDTTINYVKLYKKICIESRCATGFEILEPLNIISVIVCAFVFLF